MKSSGNTHFAIFEFVAEMSFSSESSVSYELLRPLCALPQGIVTDSLVGEPGVYRHAGWIDIHYPCNEHIKVQLRISIPEEYRNFESLKILRKNVFAHLGISDDETWELLAFAVTGQIGIEQATDRDGMSDRIY